MAKSTSGAPSQRQLRVGEVIRHALSSLLLRGDVHDPELNRHSITVSEVVMSTDLKVATAYVLPLGGKDADEALLALRTNRYEIRKQVTKGLALKFSPELRFEIDTSFDRMEATRLLFEDERVKRDVSGE
jgi:ribosome-binding factor A